jgi:Holliday junction resolvase RusA-like endonuclease
VPSLAFTVLGRAQPAGSKRAFQHSKTGRVVVVDDAAGSRPWKQQVAGEALTHRNGDGLLTGELGLELAFFFARPKSHYRTGRNSHLLKDSAPSRPVVKPDTTKLVRGVEDSLTGVVWRDDAQVVHQVADKFYGDPARVEIRVWEIPI